MVKFNTLVILAGGYGTRLGSITDNIPKPLVWLGDYPIIEHIIRHYTNYGVTRFIIALGYKGSEIKRYFRDYHLYQSDMEAMFPGHELSYKPRSNLNCKIHLVDTGADTLTGKRVALLSHLIGQDHFHITYGDGLSNIDIEKLESQHIRCKSILTISAVRPITRFGELKIKGNTVTHFEEKPQLSESWINGGFMVASRKIFEYIHGDVMLEREPMEYLSKAGALGAYRHNGFWHCMDTKKDYDHLSGLAKTKNPPWTQ
jgi:glucose-1-phosphate cytidylyltransferase